MALKKIIVITIACLLIKASIGLAESYELPQDGNIIGNVISVTVIKGDNLLKLAKRHGVGAHEILEANPDVDPKRLFIGQQVLIPTQYILPVPKKEQNGIIINIPELRLYYFKPDENKVITFPVGLGRAGWRTPTSKTTVIEKQIDPPWRVPKSIRDHTFNTTGKQLPSVIHYGEPGHPLGTRAMYLGLGGYLIHGTNANWSIGRLVSSGCIRMYNNDVELLYDSVDIGTPVRIVHKPHKVGWKENQLFLESHIPVGKNQSIYQHEHKSLHKSIKRATNDQSASVNWDKVKKISQKKHGIPQAIGAKPQRLGGNHELPLD